MDNELMQQLEEKKLIAIIRGIPSGTGERTAEALVEGGIQFLEITLNTEGALEMITELRQKFEGKLRIGAGTVLDVDMAKQAGDAGAEYIISPNLDEEVIEYCREQEVTVWPGTMTPSEMVRANKLGASAVKVFPVGSLGVRYIKDVRGPLGHINMIATGGVNLDNIQEVLKYGASAVGLGGNLVNNDWIAQGQYHKLTDTARQYVEKVEGVTVQ
ncbi:ketohydroxyglutarate aldolase [Thalassobacillus devorans]|uniref:Ketohydroxyglutarate aldolase n=1 Tax=Thalassobacillus devorans TaxID=279813 RepID=A0ABQ1NSV5_9BACI|nr:bifunctional 4-hydroxy-2-oxoglutarate aldolase/2-dehydro-3-deoxy-phosphogluconate aldolase [Thalassobacillus devorans]NIK28721.1 2-dehydro-3-deoxyphosphogluconate aldolase/(4S)-4-hydroxy-2-oxoglutarate aldolase [Thalassobacillus devorans]GGC84065.1 ketohydroxyglutarate aldolase [Thalassobacillus devorans]